MNVRINEIINKFQLKNNEELIINMPNEIFEQLKVIGGGGKDDKRGSHVTFAYSYVYLITWLYRYCKYYNYPITTDEIKQLLGYSATNKTMNYLIKKNGLLEQIGILKSTADYPIYYELIDDVLEFETISQQDEYIKEWSRKRHSNNYTIKMPVFAFERVIEGEKDNGTFYDAYQTHIIDFRVFVFCMSNKELGCTAFFLYAYLKMNNYRFSGDFKATAKRIANETGLGVQTVIKYENAMRKYNMVELLHNMDYVSSVIEPNSREASTHKVKRFDQFTKEKVKVTKLSYKATDQTTNENHVFEFKVEENELPF